MSQAKEQLIPPSDFAQMAAKNRDRLIRNNLYIVSGINLLILLLFIAEMATPFWYRLSFQPTGVVTKGTTQPTLMKLWINLLYTEFEGKYYNYAETEVMFCLSQHDQCSATFQQFDFIGSFVFGIFMVGCFLQIFDLCTVLWRACRKESTPFSSDKFRNILTICTFLLGISVFVFSTFFIKGNNQQSSFGPGFYILIGSLLCLIGTLIYEWQSMKRMNKQEILIKLLEEQRKLEVEVEFSRRSSDSFIL